MPFRLSVYFHSQTVVMFVGAVSPVAFGEQRILSLSAVLLYTWSLPQPIWLVLQPP